jgi:hypothetical protein
MARSGQQWLAQQQVRENTVELAPTLKAGTHALVSSVYQTLTWGAAGFEAKEIQALDSSIKSHGRGASRSEEMHRCDHRATGLCTLCGWRPGLARSAFLDEADR